MTALAPWSPPQVPTRVRDVYLSQRQADVLDGIVLGLSNAEIGRRLYLTENTVKSHTKGLFKALQVATRAEAVAVALSGAVDVQVFIEPKPAPLPARIRAAVPFYLGGEDAL